MLITISPEQIQRLRELVEPVNLAHLNEECEPPGYSILISFGGPYGTVAEGRCWSQTVGLGEIEVHPAQYFWTPTFESGKGVDE